MSMNKEIFTNSILQTHIIRIIWKIVDENEMNDERGGKKLLFEKIGRKMYGATVRYPVSLKFWSDLRICAFGDFNENGRQ